MTTPTYEVGDLIEYAPFGGGLREVRVTAKYEDVKNGQPGFDGDLTALPEGEGSVWGYDSQIVAVIL